MKTKTYLIFIISLLLIWLVLFIFWPRKDYVITSIIKENMVVKVWESKAWNAFKNYLLDLNTGIFTNYSGSYDNRWIIQNNMDWDTIKYSPRKDYYIKNMQIYNLSWIIKTYPNLTITREYKYWTQDRKYLIAINNTQKRKWLLWFDLWWPAIYIIDLKSWNTKQIYFYDKNKHNNKIIDIVWIVE